MRSYEQMVEDGDWPPTNKETIMFLIGCFVGGFVYWAFTAAFR